MIKLVFEFFKSKRTGKLVLQSAVTPEGVIVENDEENCLPAKQLDNFIADFLDQYLVYFSDEQLMMVPDSYYN